MIDWLRKNYDDPRIAIAGQELPIAIKRHATAKRLILRLAPDGSEVRITMPRWSQTREALKFAQSRAGWLEGQLAKISPTLPPSDSGTILYRGEMLDIDWSETSGRKPQITRGRICVGGPEASLTSRLERWLRSECQTQIETDLAHYCAAALQTPPDIRLSRAQRRWGSCSNNGTVRINWRLIMAPDHVRRSVVAHEVAHLVHFDHSPAFHRFLDQIFEGDIGDANGWLKLHGRSLYRYFG